MIYTYPIGITGRKKPHIQLKFKTSIRHVKLLGHAGFLPANPRGLSGNCFIETVKPGRLKTTFKTSQADTM